MDKYPRYIFPIKTSSRHGHFVGSTLLVMLLCAISAGQLFADVSSYRPQPAANLGPLEHIVNQRLAQIAKRQGHQPTIDSRLVRAARQVAKAFAAIPSTSRALSYENFVKFALHANGSIDAHPIAIDFNRSELGVKNLRRWYARSIARWKPTHLGVGVFKPKTGPVRVVVIYVQRRFMIKHSPRIMKANQRLSIDGRLAKGFYRPQLFIMSPNGRVRSFSIKGRSRQIHVRDITFRTTGRYVVELLANNRTGPAVVALFPIYVGKITPRLPRYTYLPPTNPILTSERAEAFVLKLINAERKRHQLPKLTMYPKLARVARRHSDDMKRHRYFGHISSRSGSLRERLSAHKIRFQIGRENISSGTHLAQLHDRLMQSPSHRVNILDRAITHAGVGVAISVKNGFPLYIVTQNFIRLTR